MARQKASTMKRDKPRGTSATEAASSGWMTARAVRETIESIVVAFILAFLFRTFEAEAFVIPTGSMAPTLMGAHKDLYCPQCGIEYRAGASGEEDQMDEQMGRERPGVPVEWATCPECRYTARVGPGTDHPTYGGDRILVSKFAYEFSDPERWDVIVFKNPSEAQTNFIKRCVGLPNETIRIQHGDLYVRPNGEKEFTITHRAPEELRAMAQIVYDNDYLDEKLVDAGWPLRWQAWPASSAANKANWQTDDGGRSFAVAPTGAEDRWLRYRHFVPSYYDWRSLDKGRLPAMSRPKPLLITDFYAYDTSINHGSVLPRPVMLGNHWVGDLLVECELDSADGKGTALLDLVKGGRHFRCQIDCETGQATLAIDGLANYKPQAKTAFHGAGAHDVIFANVDRQLRLWIDGSPVEFDCADRLQAARQRSTAIAPRRPARLGARGHRLARRGTGRAPYPLAARHLLHRGQVDQSPAGRLRW